jgi:outer membrane murein-binding lipoprotein Lpp
MNRRYSILTGCISMLFLSPEGGAGGGGGTAKPTIEAQLATANSQMASLTTERDTARTDLLAAQNEVTRLTNQFNAATTKATTAQNEVTRLTGVVSTVTTERDTARTGLVTADANVVRLESLCGVKGINKDAAVPAVPEAAGGAGGGHVYDQWKSAKGTAKARLWNKHHDDIRAEGLRRGGVEE